MEETKRSPVKSRIATGALRLFFRLLYHSFAWSYDLVAGTVSLGRWLGWVLSAANMLEGPRALELGFGPGHLQARQSHPGIWLAGLDESMQMARQAHRRLARTGITPNLARGLAQNLPYPDNTFRTVVATFPTGYITEPETLQEIRRVLLPGGRLVVLMAAWLAGKSLPERLLQGLFRATAQVPPEHTDLAQFTAPYSEAGFQASIRFVEQSGGRLMYILARKPA